MTRTAHPGADIGSAFTALVPETAGRMLSAKVPTTHAAPEDAILRGMDIVCAAAGIAPADLTRIVHGSTLATDALIEGRGARTAFATTGGFRDTLEMPTETRFGHDDLPLTPRENRFTLPERATAGGEVMIPLDPAKIAAPTDRLRDHESVAVGVLHSHLNRGHDRQVAAARRARPAELPVALSLDVSPQMREHARVSAPRTAHGFGATRSCRFRKGSGRPMSSPETGTGGGPLASVDAPGRLQVGPECAASEPGPACCRRGGTGRVGTDADLTPGRVGPAAFTGGMGRYRKVGARDGRECEVSAMPGRTRRPARGIDRGETAVALSDGMPMPGKGRFALPSGQTVRLAFPGGGICTARDRVRDDPANCHVAAATARDIHGPGD